MLNNENKKELTIESEKKLTLNERGRLRREAAEAGLMAQIRKTVDLITLVFEDNFDPDKNKVSTTGKSTQPIWYIKVAGGKLEGLDERGRVIDFEKESANAPKDEVIRFLNSLTDENLKKLEVVLDKEQGIAALRTENAYLFYLKDDEEAAMEIELN